jgi:drug/metabolite transporter (DMT)-like permease
VALHWTPRRAIVVLILCNLLWAGTYAAGKDALRALSPVELNALRFGMAGLLLLPVLWFGRRRMRIGRRDLPRLALLCLLGFVLNKAAEYTGLSLTTASDNALLIGSEGIFTALLGWLLLRERVRRQSVGGLLCGAFGVYLVIMQGLNMPHLGGGTRLTGDLLVLLALVFESLYTVVGKASLARYPGLLITAASIIGSLAVWLPAGAINVAHSGLPSMTLATWLSVIYMAIFPTVLAYLGWMVALKYVDATNAATTLFLQPLVGTGLAILLLGEHPSWGTLGGGLCIIAGVWLASRAASQRVVLATVEAEPLIG